MFQIDHARRADAFVRVRRLLEPGVPLNVWFLGLTSLLTDISSEMVTSVLPAYLVLQLGLTPLLFGAVDGLYQGVSVVTRMAGGFVADRHVRYKTVALVGYGMSALCKGLLIVVSAGPAIAAVVAGDRIGKGIRTAPRDALVALSADGPHLAAAFGVHRALDSVGAALGPFVAFAVLMAAPRAFDAVFVVSLTFALLGVAALLLFVRDPTARDRRGAAHRESIAQAPGRAPSAGVTRLAIVAAVLSAATVSEGFLYLILQRRLGFNAGAIPLLFAGTAACYFVAAIPLGRAADRFGRRAIFLAGHALLLLAYGLVFASVNPALQVGGVVGLIGAYYGATDGVLAAIGSSVLPADRRGTGLAGLATATSAGRACSSILFGYGWTIWSAGAVVAAFAGMLIAAIAVAAAMLGRGAEERAW